MYIQAHIYIRKYVFRELHEWISIALTCADNKHPATTRHPPSHPLPVTCPFGAHLSIGALFHFPLKLRYSPQSMYHLWTEWQQFDGVATLLPASSFHLFLGTRIHARTHEAFNAAARRTLCWALSEVKKSPEAQKGQGGAGSHRVMLKYVEVNLRLSAFNLLAGVPKRVSCLQYFLANSSLFAETLHKS